MFEKRILIIGPAVDLNLIERAEKIYLIHSSISRFFYKKEWMINDRVSIDIENQEDALNKIAAKFKKEIKKNTTIKNISNDFVDNVSSSIVFYFIKYRDDSLIFKYNLGKKNEASDYNEIIIRNYEIIINELGNIIFMKLINMITELLQAKIICIPDAQIAIHLNQLYGSKIEIREA